VDIAIHLGAHCTDEDRLLRTLLSEGDRLKRDGVAVPPPGKSRPALRKALQRQGKDMLGGSNPGLMRELTEGTEPTRIALSYEGFLGTYATVLSGNVMYPEAASRAGLLRDLFPGHQVHFFLGIRNPATFIPALFEASTVDDFDRFLAGHDLSAMTWSRVVRQLRDGLPDVPLTVWCNEDLPLIWPDILRAVTGRDMPHRGDRVILEEIMSQSGFLRLEGYLRDNPPASLSTWRRIVTAFLKKYARPEKIEEEIDLPGWTEDVIASLSIQYDEDVARLAGMGDVTFLRP
jgi:hypothetical protein